MAQLERSYFEKQLAELEGRRSHASAKRRADDARERRLRAGLEDMTEIKADAYVRSYGPALMVKAFIDFLRNGDPTALLPGPDGRLERKQRSSRMRPGRS